MIVVRKLVQPKISSGTKVLPGEKLKIRGLVIENKNKFPVYVGQLAERERKNKSEGL